MKFLGAFLIAAVLALATPALAQNPQTVKLCIPTSGTACANVTATNPLPVSGSFSATLAGFTPNGNYTTLTATASSSASTALPAGTVVAFQNLSAIDVSCVLATGSATATTNKLIVRAGATVYYTVGSNVNTACINQTGSASNVIGLAGGAGLGTAFGGASAGGGGGGAVTLGAGAVAAGAYVSGSVLAGAYASGAFAAGAMVDLLTMRGTVGAGTGAANSLLTGCIYNSTPITLSNGQGAAVQCNASGYPTVVVSNTLVAVTPGDGITTTIYGTAPASPVIGATLLWNGTTYDRWKSSGSTGIAAAGLFQGSSALSATNGIFSNILQGNAVLSATNPIFARATDGTRAAVVHPCEAAIQSYAPISITTATTTRIVAPSASNKTYICSMLLTSAAADNVGIVEGTGGTCGSGTAGVIGGTTAANGPNFAANGGLFIQAGGKVSVAQTAGTNVDLCLITSASTPLAGGINYVQAP